jgi:hypothetical protein
MTGPKIPKQAAPRSHTPKAAGAGKPPAAPPEPAPLPGPPAKTKQQLNRDKDAFDRAVAQLPMPSSDNPTALSAEGSKAVADARTLLSRGAGEANAAQALDRLATLSPKDFKLAMDTLSSSGHLEAMLEQLPAEGRSRFLGVASQKGYVEKVKIGRASCRERVS